MTVEAKPGTYALFCSAKTAAWLRIGRLGRFEFRPGIYAYVGSALGPGGLRARLAHHARTTKTPHWHIDYLRSCARVAGAWYSYGSERREHQWAEAMSVVPPGSKPVAGFGSSDCTCESHLFFFERPPSLQAFIKKLRILEHGHPPVHQVLWRLTEKS